MNSIKAVDFSEDLARKTEIAARILQRGMHWDMDDKQAREKAADVTKHLSSFTIDELVNAAATQSPRRTIANFKRRLVEENIVTMHESGSGRIAEVHQVEKFESYLGFIVEEATDNFVDWYKPNSTSNVDVEIKLAEHAAWQTLYKVATGKRF